MLNHRVAIFIPSTVNGNEPAPADLISRWVKRAKLRFAELFGGFTSYKAVGGWMSPVHGLVEEPVTVVFRLGKGGKQRSVPLPLPARRALQAYLESRPPVNSDLVFVGERGPLTDRGVRNLCSRYAAICDFHVHPQMEKHNINPHPAYFLGWGRVSCLACIFGMADQWASVRAIAPDLFDRLAAYERDFGCTIKKGQSVVQQADNGKPFSQCSDRELVSLALSRNYPEGYIAVPAGQWRLPPGAFKQCGGPI